MSEIIPCPFCGGEAETWDGAGPWHVVCTECGAIGSPCLSEAEAIAAWNSRAELGSDIKLCPWCGRDMDKRSEADKDNAGHTWYRDDSDYIQCLIRSNEFMKKERATHGTLTAEQVKRIHEIIEKHWHDLPAEYDMPESTALPEYSYDWQAIADELNAMLGGGECKVVASSTDGLTTDEPRQWFELSCGHTFKLYGLGRPVACPVCGKAVKR